VKRVVLLLSIERPHHTGVQFLQPIGSTSIGLEGYRCSLPLEGKHYRLLHGDFRKTGHQRTLASSQCEPIAAPWYWTA